MKIMPTQNQLLKIKNTIEKEKNRLEEIKKKLKDNIIAGLDFSKSCPGIAIIDIMANRVLYKDKFKEKNNLDFYFRMVEIKEWINHILSIFQPKAIMIESPFMNPRTANSNAILLRTHGYIGHFIMSMGIEIYMIAPTSARAFLKIKPNTKEEAFKYVQENFPELKLLDFKNDNDIADAVIVALSFFNDKRRPLNVIKEKMKVKKNGK